MDDLLKQPLAQALVRLAECPLMTQLGDQSSRQLARSTPSRMMVWPDNVPLLTPGDRYGAVIENGRQEGRGDTAQGKPYRGPQSEVTLPKSSKQEGLANRIVSNRSQKADRASSARA